MHNCRSCAPTLSRPLQAPNKAVTKNGVFRCTCLNPFLSAFHLALLPLCISGHPGRSVMPVVSTTARVVSTPAQMWTQSLSWSTLTAPAVCSSRLHLFPLQFTLLHATLFCAFEAPVYLRLICIVVAELLPQLFGS